MERIIAEIDGDKDGPLLIYIGGLHGNEYPGILALEQTFRKIQQDGTTCVGRAVALKGNLKAIVEGKRYLHADLNRVWSTDIHANEQHQSAEHQEKLELLEIVDAELTKSKGRAYLMDLHTTSAPTIPFIVTRDSTESTPFIHRFNVPYVTGLSGLLNGTMLSWFCEKGHCGLAFEAGQHQSDTSILKHQAFIYLSMVYSGFIPNPEKNELAKMEMYLSEELQPVHRHFEILERYSIDAGEDFRMVPGYSNFQKIYKGEILATNQHGQIKANMDANIFMPLYQEQGEDGFFIIKPRG